MLELGQIDLNLLLVFREILHTHSVSAAARRLDITQSAASNALNRLRKTFGDELFVRTPDGMQATPFAQQLTTPVQTALDTLTTAFNRTPNFHPPTSTRHFTLLMTDVGEVYLMPALVNHCTRAAPAVSLSTVRMGTVDMQAELAAGHIDLAVGAFDDVAGSLLRRPLFAQDYLTIFRKGHPLGEGEPTLTEFRAARHIVINNSASPYREINRVLQRSGILGPSTYQVPHFVAVPYIVSRTDLVVTVPRKLAEQACEAFGLQSVRPPWKLQNLRTDMVWHRRFGDDAGSTWLRGVLIALFGEPGNRSTPSIDITRTVAVAGRFR